mmetsp:Transcript_168899/g.324755  ORF Transcript_168899/g.324755 Transcript_168899/m.324755 type:complete len:101 (+) Transcript_168899:107-409(+)
MEKLHLEEPRQSHDKDSGAFAKSTRASRPLGADRRTAGAVILELLDGGAEIVETLAPVPAALAALVDSAPAGCNGAAPAGRGGAASTSWRGAAFTCALSA